MAIVNQERVLSVAVGAAVVVLLVLAFLQYRWSRQVGADVGDHMGAAPGLFFRTADAVDRALTIRVPYSWVTCL
jgi:hypothetical protein